MIFVYCEKKGHMTSGGWVRPPLSGRCILDTNDYKVGSLTPGDGDMSLLRHNLQSIKSSSSSSSSSFTDATGARGPRAGSTTKLVVCV